MVEKNWNLFLLESYHEPIRQVQKFFATFCIIQHDSGKKSVSFESRNRHAVSTKT
jgi:hypothetical protein